MGYWLLWPLENKGGFGWVVEGADALRYRRFPHIFACQGVPQKNGLGRLGEVFPCQYFQRIGIDRPARDKCPVRTVGANDTRVLDRDLMIHKQGELPPSILERDHG